VERARREVEITFCQYLRVGVLLTPLSLAVGAAWLQWQRWRRSTGNDLPIAARIFSCLEIVRGVSFFQGIRSQGPGDGGSGLEGHPSTRALALTDALPFILAGC
jgi:hypothetical protein